VCKHKGKVTVFVPHYAMSGGTLIALTAVRRVFAGSLPSASRWLASGQLSES
jgi:Serine dehydrogenase proteinase